MCHIALIIRKTQGPQLRQVSAPPPIVRFQVEGTVYDVEHGLEHGIANVEVVGYFGGERTQVATKTDATGHFALTSQGHAVSRSATQPVPLEVTPPEYVAVKVTCDAVGPSYPAYSSLYVARCDIGLERPTPEETRPPPPRG